MAQYYVPTSVERLVKNLQSHGFQALLVGGAVRDLIMGLHPKDWDIATDAVPDQLQAFLPQAKLVGESFGVVLVDGIEIATFRSDGIYSDGRRPDSVEYVSTPLLDSQRRDFTINALYYDPIVDLIYDYHFGMDDLDAGILRCVGEPQARFSEDYLRMLRAVRFAARFNFQLATNVRETIQLNAHNIQGIAAERVRMELERMLLQDNPDVALNLMVQTRLLSHICLELLDLIGCEQPCDVHPEGDVWTHTLMAVKEAQKSHNLNVSLAALFHDIGKSTTQRVIGDRISFIGHEDVGRDMTREILGHLKFPNDAINRVCWLVGNHMRVQRVEEMRASKFRRFIGTPGFDELVALGEADCVASLLPPMVSLAVEARKAELNLTNGDLPTPLVNGDDLIAMGLKPSPAFGPWLQQLFDCQLEGTLISKEQGLRMIKQVVEDPGEVILD